MLGKKWTILIIRDIGVRKIGRYARLRIYPGYYPSSPSNATENANAIESSLQQLKKIIESKNSYDKVMGIIHGIIQTNTQEAFNLPLKASK